MEGDRLLEQYIRFEGANFYPRPPGGGRRPLFQIRSESNDFYPRPPGGGRQWVCDEVYFGKDAFLSTPSGWRATRGEHCIQISFKISIHALRVEGDAAVAEPAAALAISIHALRVEGDLYDYTDPSTGKHFYPRPPGGGRQQD